MLKSTPLLSGKNLSRQIAGRRLWNNLTLTLHSGDRLALTGISGSGKSLFLRTLAGLDAIDIKSSDGGGSITYAGKSIERWEMPLYRTKVYYLPQRPIFFAETVEANLQRIFKFNTNHHRHYSRTKILTWLEQLQPPTVDIKPTDFLQRPAKELSGGEAQIVSLLRALQLEPQILLLDEPTASLDIEHTLRIEKFLTLWHSEYPSPNSPKRSWIWVSHNLEQLQRVCDSTFCLDSEHGN